MIFVILGAAVTLIVAYVVYTIVSSYGSEYVDNSFDAFVDNTPSTVTSSKTVNAKSDPARYFRTYNFPGKQVLILYGSEYGFSQELARELFDRLANLNSPNGPNPWQPRCINARHFRNVDFMKETILFVVMSTAGDGVAPSDAREFVAWLTASSPPVALPHLVYSVLALGDSSYLHYCRAGRSVDKRLLELGARQLVARQDVDAEDRCTIEQWFGDVIANLLSFDVETKLDYMTEIQNDEVSTSGPSRLKPFLATLKVKYDLTAKSVFDNKETIHCEFDVSNSGIQWTAGDAIGIYPLNNPSTVDEILNLTGWSSSEMVDVPISAYQPVPDTRLPVRTVLLTYCDLKTVKPELLVLVRRHSPDGESTSARLDSVLQDGLFRTNASLTEYLCVREVVDIVSEFHDTFRSITIGEFVQQLKMLLPRYYSISSSSVVDPNTVCVTAAIVRYERLGRSRDGITTTFLQDRLHVGQTCPMFVSRNPDFRLPAVGSLPIIMVGPGTGLAPFRAFIQERVHCASTGLNLLYFGCRRKEQDFLYQKELEHWVANGRLQLRTAFSRDDLSAKVYVQDLLRADADSIWSLLHKAGAHIYVCGDARHMAADVHRAVLDVACQAGGLSDSDAETFVAELESTGRYQRDVWVT